MKRNATDYVVVYRVGNADNFRWLRSRLMSKKEAQRVAQDSMTMGEPSYAVNADQSFKIGLPETFDANSEVR